jgi:hypothetical protein
VVGHVEVEIETGEVAPGLLFDLVDVELGKEHPPFGVIGVRQRQKALGEEPFVADLCRAHGRQLLPVNPGGELDPYPLLNRLAARHGHSRGRLVGEFVALGEQVHLALHHRRLLFLHLFLDCGEVLGASNRGIAGLAHRPLGRQSGAADQHDGGHQQCSETDEPFSFAFQEGFSFPTGCHLQLPSPRLCLPS